MISLFIYFVFISISMANCYKFDLESAQNNLIKPIACELNCLKQQDPSNFHIIANSLEYFSEFQLNNFTKPLNQFCNQLNSSLLDNINEVEDILDKNFRTTFDQRTEKLEEEILEFKKKILMYSNGLSMLNGFDFITEINQAKYIQENKIFFKELQNCRINYLDKYIVLKIQSKILTIEFNKNEDQKLLTKKMNENIFVFSDTKSLLNHLKLSGKLQSFIKFAIKRHCRTRHIAFEFKKINLEEFCNQTPKYL